MYFLYSFCIFQIFLLIFFYLSIYFLSDIQIVPFVFICYNMRHILEKQERPLICQYCVTDKYRRLDETNKRSDTQRRDN